MYWKQQQCPALPLFQPPVNLRLPSTVCFLALKVDAVDPLILASNPSPQIVLQEDADCLVVSSICAFGFLRSKIFCRRGIVGLYPDNRNGRIVLGVFAIAPPSQNPLVVFAVHPTGEHDCLGHRVFLGSISILRHNIDSKDFRKKSTTYSRTLACFK
jgi:hypothetical protein